MARVSIDNDVATALAQILTAAGHPAVTARGQGMDAADDDEQLLFAAQHGWVLVTHNRGDFELLHKAWWRWSAAWGVSVHHAGILVIEQIPMRPFVQPLVDFLTNADPPPNSYI
jgi:hypothetical protein